MKLRFPIIAAALAASALSAAAADPYRPAPVSISSANYADTPREQLLQSVNSKNQVNPETRVLEPLAAPQRYVFVPGELYESDIPFEEICRRLSAALAKKGFINAANEKGWIKDADKVDLILRVHSGQRPWRNPTVRTEQLTWRDGLAARPRGRSLATLGGDVSWDSRAGGNDSAFAAPAANENATGFAFGSTPGTTGGTSPMNMGSAVGLTNANSSSAEYEATRDFYLIVVDAFSYSEVKQKAESARRLWTTFIAAPRQHGEKFSDVLNTMLRMATPYFGETTGGLQMFNDARATVTIGETRVIESDVKDPRK